MGSNGERSHSQSTRSRGERRELFQLRRRIQRCCWSCWLLCEVITTLTLEITAVCEYSARCVLECVFLYVEGNFVYSRTRRCMVSRQITLSELCIPASSVNYRSHLRSTHQGDLIVPWIRLARYGQRAFAYAAPCIWNSLPTDLKDYNLSLAVFKRRLKSYFLTRHNL